MHSQLDVKFAFGPLKLANLIGDLKCAQSGTQRLEKRHLEWLTWLDLNSMINDKDLQNKCYEDLESSLEQSHGLPSTPRRLKYEFCVLYKLGCGVLTENATSISAETWWLSANSTLERAFFQTTQSNPTYKRPSPDNCLSLIQPILAQTQYLEKEELYEPFLLVCCALCWIFLISGQVDKSKNLATILAKLFPNQQSSGGVTDNIADWKDVVHLTCAISNFENTKEATAQFNNIRCSIWLHTITYFKACLLSDASKYDEALQLVTPLVQQHFKDLETKLKPRLCALVGTCLSQSGLHHLAIDWFRKALTENPSWLTPLWQISNEYFVLKKSEPACSSLKLMAQAAKAAEENCERITTGGKRTSELSFQEALYILAFRLNYSGFHEEAHDYYNLLMKTFPNLEDSDWNLVHRPSLSQIYLEVADAALHSEHLQECLELCDLVLANSSEQEKKLSPGCYKDILDYCDEKYSDSASQEQNVSQLNTALAYAIKAAACFQLGKDEESASLLKNVLAASTVLDREESGPVSKRPRLESPIENDRMQEQDVSSWQRLISQCYSNLAVLRLKRGLKKDALHALRISLTAWSDNLDALHNYVLLLLQMSNKDEASVTWQKAKDRTLAALLNQDNPYWMFNVTPEALRNLDNVLTLQPL